MTIEIKLSKYVNILNSYSFCRVIKIKCLMHSQRQMLLLSCIRMIFGTSVTALKCLEVRQASASSFDRHWIIMAMTNQSTESKQRRGLESLI